MTLSIGLILLGLILLVAGGETLLRGAVGLATLLRLTPAVIGLTVVAAGTSVPELAVSAIAALKGSADITVGNVVGSNIFNIAFILGLSALVRPLVITGNTIKLEYPVMALVTLMCIAVSYDGMINAIDAALFLAVYLGFTVYMVSLVRQQMTATEATDMKTEVQKMTPGAAPPDAASPGAKPSGAAPPGAPSLGAAAPGAASRPNPWVCFGLLGGGVALLGAGAHATVTGAVDLARILGWSERVIGLTIVAGGTGLPEAVTSLVSTYRGRDDVAIGNIIGSNLFNILGILGLSAVFAPLAIAPKIVASDNWWMLGITLLLFPLMFTGMRINRWEGGTLLGVYAIYLGLLLGRE